MFGSAGSRCIGSCTRCLLCGGARRRSLGCVWGVWWRWCTLMLQSLVDAGSHRTICHKFLKRGVAPIMVEWVAHVTLSNTLRTRLSCATLDSAGAGVRQVSGGSPVAGHLMALERTEARGAVTWRCWVLHSSHTLLTHSLHTHTHFSHTVHTHFSHTLHTLFTHTHTFHTLFTHFSHTFHTLFTHFSHTFSHYIVRWEPAQ